MNTRLSLLRLLVFPLSLLLATCEESVTGRTRPDGTPLLMNLC